LDLTFSLANTFKMKFLAKGYGVAAPTLLAVEPDICLGLRAHLVVTIKYFISILTMDIASC
jgi:hypothetical protein